MHGAPNHARMFEALPHTQVLARSVLALLLGTGLVAFAHSPWVTVINGVTLLLMADGALGLVLYRRAAGSADEPWSAWLRPLWSFNCGLSLMLLLGLTILHVPLTTVVIGVLTAVTTGVWWVTLLHSKPRLYRALLIWTTLLFVSAAALPVVWTLGLTPLDAWSPRVLGGMTVLLGLLMLLFLRRSWAGS